MKRFADGREKRVDGTNTCEQLRDQASKTTYFAKMHKNSKCTNKASAGESSMQDKVQKATGSVKSLV